jgi:hypothetical protein
MIKRMIKSSVIPDIHSPPLSWNLRDLNAALQSQQRLTPVGVAPPYAGKRFFPECLLSTASVQHA